MLEVFMPMNLKMEHIIIANSHLMLGGIFPDCFHALLAHVAAYKPVLKKWEEGDFGDHLSLIDFPSVELHQYLSTALSILQTQQQELLRTYGLDAKAKYALNQTGSSLPLRPRR